MKAVQALWKKGIGLKQHKNSFIHIYTNEY